MRFLLTLILFGIVTASCSPASQKTSSNVPAGNINIVSVATEGAVAEDASNATNSPSTIMTVNSPVILLTPIQGNVNPVPTPVSPSTAGWKTYTNSTLGIALDYPPDWSVTEQSDGATFTSPQGTTILLKASKADTSSNEFKVGNQHCTSRTNAHGLAAEICGDTIAVNYSATFTIKAKDGSTQLLSISTSTHETGTVFEAMFNSVRLNQ